MKTPLALVATLPLWCLSTASAGFLPEEGPQEEKSIASDGTRDLGSQIKAAVMIGMIDSDAAASLAKAIMAFEESTDGDWKAASDDAGAIPVWQVFALPEGGSLHTLLEPEFLPRDAAFLVRASSLDSTASAIIETLLADYASRFDRQRLEILDAVASARRAGATIAPEAIEAFETIADADLDRDLLMQDLPGLPAGKDGAGKGEAAADPAVMEKWIDWAVAEAAGLQRRVAAIQTLRQDADSNESPEQATAAALGRVQAFRSARSAWRRSLEEDLAAIVPAALHPELTQALARLRVEHGRRRGRFGGDTVDLQAAWTSAIAATGIDETSVGSGPEALDTRLPDLAASIDARTAARISTECAALRWYFDGLVGDQRGVDREARVVEDAADLQVTAELAVRDLTLAIGETMAEAIEETSPASATALRAEIRSRAFPEQCRRRWCETALAVALGLHDLTEEQREAIVVLTRHLQVRIDRLRDVAIEERLRREVRIARAMAEAIIDGYAAAKSLDEQTWDEPERDRFDRLDTEIDTALRGILTPDQVERLPTRASNEGRRPDGKADGKAGMNQVSGKNPRSESGRSPGKPGVK